MVNLKGVRKVCVCGGGGGGGAGGGGLQKILHLYNCIALGVGDGGIQETYIYKIILRWTHR